MKRDYHVDVIDKDGHSWSTWGECSADGTEATKERLNKWASKYGHTILFDTYREVETDYNPAFVDACLSDIAGFKR